MQLRRSIAVLRDGDLGLEAAERRDAGYGYPLKRGQSLKFLFAWTIWSARNFNGRPRNTVLWQYLFNPADNAAG
jgi:hypothetical protein